MNTQSASSAYTIGDDEKVSRVMIYTFSLLCWGDVITKEMIRVSTWLRTNAAPDHVTLLQAKVLQVQQPAQPKPTTYEQLHIPCSQIIAMHLLPPAQDPIDYDPMDGVRHQEPVTLMIGPYQMAGNLLISQKADINKYLEITKESFPSLYDVEISYPMVTSTGKLKVPFLIYRFSKAIFSVGHRNNLPQGNPEAG